MKKLKVEIYNTSESEHPIDTLICERLDAVSSHTTLHGVRSLEKILLESVYLIPAQLDRMSILDGCVTLYYKTGFHIDILRVK